MKELTILQQYTYYGGFRIGSFFVDFVIQSIRKTAPRLRVYWR